MVVPDAVLDNGHFAISRPYKAEDRDKEKEHDRADRERDRDRDRDNSKERENRLKYLNKPISELDLSACERCTPSYRRLPKNVHFFYYFTAFSLIFVLSYVSRLFL